MTKIIKICSIALAFFMLAHSASADYITEFNQPPNTFRFGFALDSSFFRYGSASFTVNDPLTISTTTISICAETFLNNDVNLAIYRFPDAGGKYSDFNVLGQPTFQAEYPITIQGCLPDGSATTTNPDGYPQLNEIATPFVFDAGFDYFLYIIPVDKDDMYKLIFGYSNSNGEVGIPYVEYCALNLFCGNDFLNSPYAQSSQLAFVFGVVEPPPPAGECGILDLYQCFVDALVFTFIPSTTAFDPFIALKDNLKTKAPFGYFTGAYDALSTFSTSTAPQYALASSTPIYALIFSPMRTGLSWIIILAGLYWLYKRLTNIII